MKTISHIQKMRTAAQTNKQAIQRLLGWNELQYCEFQEQRGREYLRAVICPDGYGLRELGDSRIFWRWWINQWNRRDDDFINSDIFKQERERQGNHAAYFEMHSPEYLRDQYPHRVVFERSYSIMIGELLDNK